MNTDAFEKVDTAEGLLTVAVKDIENLKESISDLMADQKEGRETEPKPHHCIRVVTDKLGEVQSDLQKAQAWLWMANADHMEALAAEQRGRALEVFRE
jgi:hypothetical protein